MRILMLHGHGASASIFKAQTLAFRSRLDDSFVFGFIDAPYASKPSPGLDTIFQSCHYTWYPKHDVGAIRASHRWLLDYIREHGPYDSVCCFSQGCALVASLLLYHAREAPGESLPFKSAIFICGGVSYAVLDDLGIAVTPKARQINEASGKLLQIKTGALAHLAGNLDEIQKGVGLWDDTDQLLHDPSVLPDQNDCFGIDMTSLPPGISIKIPTLHIYGAKDPRWPSSIQLAYLCEDREMYDHRGGHDIPRLSDVSEDIAERFRCAATKIRSTCEN